MSTNTAQAASPLPNYDDAYATLFGELGNRVYFSKLASLGHQVTTQKQAEALLELGAKLEALQEEPAVKAAEDAYDPYLQANAILDHLLSERGLDTGIRKSAAESENLAIKRAAAEWMQDPAIYNSVLSLRAHEAHNFAQQSGLLPAA